MAGGRCRGKTSKEQQLLCAQAKAKGEKGGFALSTLESPGDAAVSRALRRRAIFANSVVAAVSAATAGAVFAVLWAVGALDSVDTSGAAFICGVTFSALPLLLALVLVWSASQAGDFEQGSLDGMPANGDSDGVPCADCKS